MAEQQHIPLPLKYRPMTFDDVVGQEHVVRTLRHAIEANRIANAYLFIGPRGIGKTTTSRIFAKALNCTSPNGVEPCGKCVNCEEIAAGRSLDVVELKIFIIDECHMLSTAAWNALLKTLEEPPPHVRFIFATTEGDKVLATIISRCQRFDLRRIQTNDIVSRLRHVCELEKIDAEEDALLAIARGAEGGMRDALSSLDQLVSFKGEKVTEEDALGVFGLVSRSALEGLAGAILKGDVGAILSSIEAFDSAGKNMRRLTGELLRHFRNLVVVQALGPNAKSLEATPDQIKVLAAQAQAVDPGRLFRICDQLADAEDKLRYVLSVRTLIEMTLIRASRIATTATVEELMKAVRELKSTGDVGSLRSARSAAPTEVAVAPVAAPVAPAKPPREEPSAPPAAPTPEPPPPRPAKRVSRSDILNDKKLNDVLASLPGAVVSDIREA